MTRHVPLLSLRARKEAVSEEGTKRARARRIRGRKLHNMRKVMRSAFSTLGSERIGLHGSTLLALCYGCPPRSVQKYTFHKQPILGAVGLSKPTCSFRHPCLPISTPILGSLLNW